MAITAVYANPEKTAVVFTDNADVTRTVPADWKGEFRMGHVDGGGVVGFLANGGTIQPYVAPPEPFAPLSRPAFLFMMNKIGVTEATVEGIIAAMPENTQEQIDAKTLALIVFRNQQTFQRDNTLLVQLATAAGLTSEQVDAAWRQAEQIVW